MSDIFDLAAEAEQRFRDEALRWQAQKLPAGDSAKRCTDCGEPIPAKRRRAIPGVATCVDCQEERERFRR